MSCTRRTKNGPRNDQAPQPNTTSAHVHNPSHHMPLLLTSCFSCRNLQVLGTQPPVVPPPQCCRPHCNHSRPRLGIHAAAPARHLITSADLLESDEAGVSRNGGLAALDLLMVASVDGNALPLSEVLTSQAEAQSAGYSKVALHICFCQI